MTAFLLRMLTDAMYMVGCADIRQGSSGQHHSGGTKGSSSSAGIFLNPFPCPSRSLGPVGYKRPHPIPIPDFCPARRVPSPLSA